MEKAIELLDSVVELHLGSIDMPQWLQRLAQQTNAAGATSASWLPGEFQHAEISASADEFSIQAEWLPFFDQVIKQAAPAQPGLLDTIMLEAGIQETDADNPMNDPSWMIAFLDSYPARTVLALRAPASKAAWDEVDRQIFAKVLPVLLKAHQLHKKIVVNDNRLKIANKILDSTPRGLISLTPAGEILRTNSMGKSLLANSDDFAEENGKLIINDAKTSLELHQQLTDVARRPLETLESFSWNRLFSSPDGSVDYQLTLNAYRLEGWRLESNPYDRYLILYLWTPEYHVLPNEAQLIEFYDLTKAQAKLVLALMEGKNIEAAAGHLNVSINTIRSHLRAIYSKLKIDSKADLLRIVSRTYVGYTDGRSQ